MNRTKNNKEANSILAYVMCIFWTAFMAAILIYIICASLSTSREIFSGTVFRFESGFHFENFVAAWTTADLSQYFLNSMIYAVIAVTGGLCIAAPAAYVLSRHQFFGRNLIKRGLVLAMSIPSILILLPIYALMIQLNIRGRIALCFVYICMRVPFSTIFLMNFFESISNTYAEAASLDGCSESKVFVKIMLPMVKPAIGTVAMIGFLGVFNEYFVSMMLLTDKTASSLGVGLNRIISVMKYAGNYPGIFAAVLIVMLPSLIVFIVASKKIMYGNMGGGIKG